MKNQYNTLNVLLAVGLACLLIAGCKVNQPPPTDDLLTTALPETTVIPDQWAADALDTGKVDDGWVETFNDPRLNSLVAEAMTNNINLRISAAQVERAAALARIAGAALKPTVGVGGAALGTQSSGSAFEPGAGGVGVGVSWEVDVWGRVRAGTAAAEETLRATEADFEFARQSLAAQTSKSWFVASEAKLQVALSEEIVGVYGETLRLAEARVDIGKSSSKDVHLARGNVASAEDALRQARIASEQSLRSLEVLLGRYPSADLESASELVSVPPPIPAGVPSDIIARRPDLLAAERRVASAFFLTEEARLAKLPRFSLSAGTAMTDLAGAIGGLGAGIVAPLYTGGALEGQLEAATADQKAAVATYAQTVLVAFQEVESALTNERLLTEREAFLEAVVAENMRALELSGDEYEVGKTDLLNVLIAQERWVGGRIGLLRIRSERLLERVNLHLALGGSFEELDLATTESQQ